MPIVNAVPLSFSGIVGRSTIYLMKIQILLLLFFVWHAAPAQSTSNYTRFSNQVDTASDKESKLRYARLWLEQARSEKNFGQEVKALREAMYNDNRDLLLRYADSLICAAQNTRNAATIGQAYLTKGIAHYNQNQHAAALNAYMKADEYLNASGADYDIYKLKHGIANTKYYLGFYYEAISLYEQCRIHYQTTDVRGYLSAIYSLGLCYNRLGDYERSQELNRLGFAEQQRLEYTKIHGYFSYSSGVNDYYLRRYTESLDQLQQSSAYLNSIEDYSNEAVTWFYMGKVHFALKEPERALVYLKKVDSSFYQQKYIRPDLRQTYEILIKHYNQTGDYKNEIHYIRRLKSVDSVLNRDYKYLSNKLTKEYDNRKLNKAYAEALDKINFRDNTILCGCLVFAVASALGIRKYMKLRRYHKNYKKLMAQPLEPSDRAEADIADTLGVENPQVHERHAEVRESATDLPKPEKELKPETVDRALANLADFERNEKFTDSEIGVKELSDILETNTTYARQIVQQHRGKQILHHLHDLRLEFIIRKLRTENRFRNYTDEALAAECGFGSTKNFTRAFKARYDMPPRFFIRQLKKDLGEE